MISIQRLTSPPSEIKEQWAHEIRVRCEPESSQFWFKIRSRFITTGGVIVLGLMIAGAIGTPLSWFLGEDLAFLMGFTAGSLFVIALSWFWLRDEDQPRAKSPPEQFCIDAIKVNNIVRVEFVDGLEDFGPGYVIHTSDAESVYVRGENFVHDEELDEWTDFPQSILLYVTSDTKDILHVQSESERIPCNGHRDFGLLQVSIHDDFALLKSREDIPATNDNKPPT